MKRTISFVLLCVVVFALASCKSKAEPLSEDEVRSTAQTVWLDENMAKDKDSNGEEHMLPPVTVK